MFPEGDFTDWRTFRGLPVSDGRQSIIGHTWEDINWINVGNAIRKAAQIELLDDLDWSTYFDDLWFAVYADGRPDQLITNPVTPEEFTAGVATMSEAKWRERGF